MNDKKPADDSSREQVVQKCTSECTAADSRHKFVPIQATGKHEGEFGDWLSTTCAVCRSLKSNPIHTGDDQRQERIYPYQACPRDSYPMDPLEGCSDCKGVGYHRSIPNPEFKHE